MFLFTPSCYYKSTVSKYLQVKSRNISNAFCFNRKKYDNKSHRFGCLATQVLIVNKRIHELFVNIKKCVYL